MARVDYSKLSTERPNLRSRRLGSVSVEETLRILHREDARVPAAVWKTRRQIARGVRLIVASLKSGGRLFFAGAGTSGRLGIIEAAECPPTFNTPPALVQAVMAGGRSSVFRSREGAEDREAEARRFFRRTLSRRDVVVGISASGVTPYVRGALRAARQKNARTILVACNGRAQAGLPRRQAGHRADCLIAPQTGPEVITGSTRLKAGTATKLVLNMLTVASMTQLGKVYRNWMVDLQPKSRKLKDRALRIIREAGRTSAGEAARTLRRARNNVKLAVLMARTGWDYPRASRRLRETRGFLEKALA